MIVFEVLKFYAIFDRLGGRNFFHCFVILFEVLGFYAIFDRLGVRNFFHCFVSLFEVSGSAGFLTILGFGTQFCDVIGNLGVFQGIG